MGGGDGLEEYALAVVQVQARSQTRRKAAWLSQGMGHPRAQAGLDRLANAGWKLLPM